MKDDLRYTPSDCFETFPFPDCVPKSDQRPVSGPAHGTDGIGLATSGDGSASTTGQPSDWTTNPNLESAGQAYYEYRAALMVRNDEGMTKTYNRFHDPYEDDPEIARAPRAARRPWTEPSSTPTDGPDIPTDCDFLLDYEIDEATWGRKKKPYRYRWPDAIRDEVLARLLALNAERAAEEARASNTSRPTRGKSKPDLTPSRYGQTPTFRPNLMVAEPKTLWPSRDD